MRSAILGVFLGWLSAILPCAAAEPPRLNVLWICADDHAAYMLGAYGNKQVRTPNLDRLAAEGIRFDRAYCNSPVCTASRQSFLTGRYPRTIGVTQLRTPLPESEVTLAELLKEVGYDTAAIGKMHFNSTLKHGFDLRYDTPEHRKELAQRGATPLPPNVQVQPPWRPFKDHARTWLNSANLPLAMQADMAAEAFTRKSVEFLEAKREAPFFLMVSFTEPHSPFHYPVELRNRHKPESFAVPKVGAEDAWHIPAIFRDLTDQEKQGIIAAYATSVEYLDYNVGRVLDALKRSGKEKETLVIYTGDHGYMLGHHGRFEKHCSFEQAVRSPLILRWPGRVQPGRSTDALVEFVDIVPTVLQACNVNTPKNVQGHSLMPLLSGRAKMHRPYVICEYAENEEAMIRTDQFKLIYITGKRERQDGYTTGKPLPGRTILLFDLRSDPEEMTNVAARPEYATTRRGLLEELAAHLRRTARLPEHLPKDGDILDQIDFMLQPRDVEKP